jgi:hypothetical protein
MEVVQNEGIGIHPIQSALQGEGERDLEIQTHIMYRGKGGGGGEVPGGEG